MAAPCVGHTVHEGGQAQPRAGGKDLVTSIQSHGNTFSREFLQKARSLLSLDQKGLVYISQPKVFAHKTSYRHSENFLDHRNIVSKKYYNSTIKSVLEAEPLCGTLKKKKKAFFKALTAD